MDTLWQLWQTVVVWAGIAWTWVAWAWGWLVYAGQWVMQIDMLAMRNSASRMFHEVMNNSATEVAYLANFITILAPILAYFYRGFLADIFIRFDNQEQKRALQRFLVLTTASINASNSSKIADAQKNQKELVEEIHNNRYVFKSKVFEKMYKIWQQANNELRNNISYIAKNQPSKISTDKLKEFQDYVGNQMQIH